MEKLLSSVVAVLIPFIATYFSKKNKEALRKNLIDEAQKKIDFINSYFDVQTKVLPESEIPVLKMQLSAELNEVKNSLQTLHDLEKTSDYEKLGIIQKIFLTFKPKSWLGLVWAILFYITLILTLFIVLSLFLDNEGNFTIESFTQNMTDLYLVGLLLPFLLLFRWLAVRNYRIISEKEKD